MTTCAASATTASHAASSGNAISCATFVPFSGCTRFSVSAAAVSKSTTAGERVELELHEVARVLGDVAALGDDERDRVADEAHVGVGERAQRRVGRIVEQDRRLHRTGAGLRSAAVSTATTPGSAFASSTSIDTMRALAMWLRTNAACSMPGNAMSST